MKLFITLLVYNKGDFFGKHIDNQEDYKSSTKTVKSGGYLLNTDYTGGEFLIEGKPLQVKVGELFLFGRNVEHEIKEVTSGVRYSLHFGVSENKPKSLL